MFKKLLGGKKDFYLELKEEESKTATAPTEAPVEASVAEVPQPETAPKSKKTSIKKGVAKGKETKPVATPIPAPVVTPSQNGKSQPQEVEFATKYLITDSASRRRPGPSLNSFKTMARQLKKPMG
jgi:hypothetical protein